MEFILSWRFHAQGFVRLRRRLSAIAYGVGRKPRAAYSTIDAASYEGWISPWMNARDRPSDLCSRSGRFGGVGKEGRPPLWKKASRASAGVSSEALAKEGASADFAEEMKYTAGVNPWRFHPLPPAGRR
ncbi:MAG: hypothetical protein QF619_03270 [Candidatus Binatia bacterium]|nr:hypothetical protein [Candidatus Binatia bacterium]